MIARPAARAVLRRMTAADAPAVAALADLAIGPGYYSPPEVEGYLDRSRAADGVALSYVAHQGPRLLGFRFVLPPGAWESGRGPGLHPEAWPAPLEQAAYFQSCFVDPVAIGLGIGRRLATLALHDLATRGIPLVVTHSWKESPHDSSRRYLRRLGFVEITELPEYWREVDYTCSRCGRPCLCTAVECVRPVTSADLLPEEP